MASREELEALRDLARKRHRAATQKVSRLRAKGVELAGTKNDPRKETESFKRMNSIQLRAHIGRLDKFTSRGTQFVPSAHKTKPLTGNKWQRYKTLERMVNAKNAKPYETIKNQFINTLGMTVDEFVGTKPTHPQTGNPASRAPHLPKDQSSKGVPNDKQLSKLIRDMERKLSSDYDAKVNRRDKATAIKLMKTFADKAMMKDVKGMSAKQFSFMWNYTDFARAASQDYLIAQAHMHDPKSLAAFYDTFDTQMRYMKDIIKDVKNLDL